MTSPSDAARGEQSLLDQSREYLTNIANAFDPIEGPAEFAPDVWAAVRHAIYTVLSAQAPQEPVGVQVSGAFSLRHLQKHLPWTIPYSSEFETSAKKNGQRRIGHDVLHVMKSLGRIAADVEAADHLRPRKLEGNSLAKEVADLVICALHIARLEGFDLQDAVVKNSEARNAAGIPPEAQPQGAQLVEELRDQIESLHERLSQETHARQFEQERNDRLEQQGAQEYHPDGSDAPIRDQPQGAQPTQGLNAEYPPQGMPQGARAVVCLKLVRKVLAKDKPMIGSRDESLLCAIEAALSEPAPQERAK